MDDIAEAAGVTKPVLYQHFSSKLELYLAVLDQAIDELLAAADKALRSTADNKLRVQATMRAYFAFVDAKAGGYQLLFESDVMSQEEVRQRVDRAHALVAQRIAAVIAEDTDLTESQTLLLGSALQGMAQVAATRWLADPHEEMTRDNAADLVAALAWRGIRGFPLSHPRAAETEAS
jgi:AcrR family transcriptional regulator